MPSCACARCRIPFSVLRGQCFPSTKRRKFLGAQPFANLPNNCASFDYLIRTSEAERDQATSGNEGTSKHRPAVRLLISRGFLLLLIKKERPPPSTPPKRSSLGQVGHPTYLHPRGSRGYAAWDTLGTLGPVETGNDCVLWMTPLRPQPALQHHSI